MADPQKIARLADFHEFAELKTHFDAQKKEAEEKLGRQMVANPDLHGETEARHLKSFYAGIDAVLRLPQQEKAKLKKERSA